MEDIWVAVVGSVGSTIVAMLGLFGVYLRMHRDDKIKQLEGDSSKDVALIQTGSQERMHVMEQIMARVETLEQETQVKERMIVDLTKESSVAIAKAQLAEAEKKMMSREIMRQDRHIAELQEEIRVLKAALQGEVSEALMVLDEESENT